MSSLNVRMLQSFAEADALLAVKEQKGEMEDEKFIKRLSRKEILFSSS